MGILNAHKAIDVKGRAVEHGLVAATAAAAASGASSVLPPEAGRIAATIASPVPKDQVLRLAEEQLEVGKRLFQAGTTRIRRFVTTKPVEAQVTLHEEHANVVRRAVSDPSYLKDIDWSDKTVEVTETAEEAVVSKSAHIAEEVIISKTGTDRVETVHETVRRQQVEVEREGLTSADKTKKAG